MRLIRSPIVVLIMGLMFITSCGKEDVGAISGTVVIEEGETTELGSMTIFIPGTSHMAMTDENGEYTISDLPQGTYTVKISIPYPEGTEVTDIEVKAGQTTIAPDLESSISFSSYYWDLSSVYFHNKSSGHLLDIEYLMTERSEQEVEIRGRVYSYSDGEEQYVDQTMVLTVSVNDSSPVTVPIRKNGFSYDLAELNPDTGKNTIVISATDDSGTVKTEELTLYYYPSADSLLVTLTWDKIGDMDLHLIGPDGTDCHYANKHPDWGVTGDKSDDPLFFYDERSGYGSAETIVLANPPDGTYLVKVCFFGYQYEPSRREALRPSVEIVLRGKEYSFSAIRSMNENDEWQVTSFTLPGGKPMAPAARM